MQGVPSLRGLGRRIGGSLGVVAWFLPTALRLAVLPRELPVPDRCTVDMERASESRPNRGPPTFDTYFRSPMAGRGTVIMRPIY